MALSLKEERQFHDSWAFYLFLILTVVINTFYLINIQDFTTKVQELHSQIKFDVVFFSNLAFVLLYTLLVLILCFTYPVVIIVISVLTVPISSLIIEFNYILTLKDYVLPISIVIFIANLLFLIFFYFKVYVNIDYISQVLSSTAKMFFSNILSIFGMQILNIALMGILLVPAIIAIPSFENKTMMALTAFAIIFQMLWLIKILSYFMNVFVSSLVFCNITKKINIVNTALYNSFMALGTISIGALVISFIRSLQFFVADQENRMRGNRENNGLTVIIITAIAKFLLSIVGDFAEFVNSLVLPYTSINGTNFVESVRGSFEAASSTKGKFIISFFSISTVSAFFSLAYIQFIVGFNYLIFKNLLGFDITSSSYMGYFALTCFVCTLIFIEMINLLSNTSLALVFASISYPNEVSSYDPEFYELTNTIEKQYSNLNSTASSG